MGDLLDEFPPVSASRPCPACRKTDWCLLARDESGHLIREPGRDELTVRRVLEGASRKALNLRVGSVWPTPAIEPAVEEGPAAANDSALDCGE